MTAEMIRDLAQRVPKAPVRDDRTMVSGARLLIAKGVVAQDVTAIPWPGLGFTRGSSSDCLTGRSASFPHLRELQSASERLRGLVGRRRDVIVVGVDGSEASKATLRFAVEEARRWHTRLHVVHAFWEWEPIPGTGEVELERTPQEREEWLAAFVREVVGEVADIEISSSTVEDDAAPALIAAAQDAELLIVGSRGHGGFGGLLLGSISQQCAHHASCSVVIVREPAGRKTTQAE